MWQVIVKKLVDTALVEPAHRQPAHRHPVGEVRNDTKTSCDGGRCVVAAL
jgi:hypothetical protein